MNKNLVNNNGIVVNCIVLPDDWTGAEGEWPVPKLMTVCDVGDGDIGDTVEDGKYVPPQPFESWVRADPSVTDKSEMWVAPVEKPAPVAGTAYIWDEPTRTWKATTT